MSAPASVAIRGSLPPIPAWRFHWIHRGRRSDRAVFVFSRGGVSSIAFYISDSWSDFFLTPAMSAAASAAARRCLLPILRRRTCSLHHMQCRTRAMCENSRCGGCFDVETTHRKKSRKPNPRHLQRHLPPSVAVRRLFRCDERARHIVGDAWHARFFLTCDKGWVLSYFLSMNFNAIFFLTRLMSATTSTAAHRCLPPNPARRADS